MTVNGLPGDEGGAPRRTSMRDRMAQASARSRDPGAGEDGVRAGGFDFSAPLGDSSDLTSTSVRALSSLSDFPTAFVVGEEGVERTDAPAPIAAKLSASGPAGVIGLDDARSHHLLLLADEVDPAEIEALALSIWDAAGWEGAGRLRLTSEALLEGPWRVDAAARKALKTPAALTNVWILRCPRAQRRPVPGWALDVDEWAKVFPAGTPTGLEYRVLEALKRMARRLGGGVRIADSGAMVSPDPDSAVSLSVYSPRWVEPEELEGLLSAEFPLIVDSREAAPPPERASAAEEAALRRARESVAPMREDVATKIRRAKEAASSERARGGQVVKGYALLTPIANRSDLAIEVRPVPVPPQVLRWESWTTGVIIEYSLRWLPGGSASARAGASRAARLERMRSSRDIERAASLVATAVAGSIVDEDGFLVALEDTAIQ